MCTLAMLFWHTIPSPSKCSGVFELFGKSQSVTTLLKSHKCFESKDCFEVSAQNLMINRITPFTVDPGILANISMCRFHKASWF